ncbi:hypothetical protein AMTR_s00037p00230460 [Amborella trichopoda]|uniref:Retrotransposon gag domain-containing protein n=1 Tax=Amborella trichopoda TaxID=13333 RepID=U5D4Q6_AMBTC|nr:hypothetical protein AMTR_s00037p00230460 [Amborella trichopoda]
METLESHTLVQLDRFKEDLESTLNAEEERVGCIESLEKNVMDAICTIQAELDTLNASLEETKGRTLFVGSTSGIKDVPRADLPKPKEFKAVRDAKEVENFLWQVERYFEGLNLEDKQVKVRTASLFLTDNAILWWRRKHADMEKGLCTQT